MLWPAAESWLGCHANFDGFAVYELTDTCRIQVQPEYRSSARCSYPQANSSVLAYIQTPKSQGGELFPDCRAVQVHVGIQDELHDTHIWDISDQAVMRPHRKGKLLSGLFQ